MYLSHLFTTRKHLQYIKATHLLFLFCFSRGQNTQEGTKARRLNI